MRTYLLATIAALSLIAAPSFAQDTGTNINDASSDWRINSSGPHKVISDATVQGGKATLVQTPGTGASYEVGALNEISGAISKGDHIVATVWTRSDVPTQITYRIEIRVDPWTALNEAQISVGTEWKQQTLDFISAADYAAGSTQVALLLNTGKQTIYLGPVTVVDKKNN